MKNKIMAEDLKTAGQSDDVRQANNEHYELLLIAEKMRTTVDNVREAIRIVGHNRDYLEAYLKR